MKLILPIFLLLITPILSDSLSELNKKGVNAIYKKEFEKAVSYFQESLKISERDAKANYNLACTYSLMIQKDFCTNMELIDKVFFHLSIATKEDSYYKSKMLKDSDLEILKSNYSFYKIAGLSKKEILEKVTWYGPSPGAYGPVDKFIFKANGKFIYRKINLENSTANLEWDEATGTYSWEGEFFWLKFNKSKLNFPLSKQKVKFKDGILEVEGFDHRFSDNTDPCSA